MRIHIFGASGSGTTTLGKALAEKLNCRHFDSDTYFWEDVGEYRKRRSKEQRTTLLLRDLTSSNEWVLSGSLCNWSNVSIQAFIDVAVFLYIPHDLRMKRLEERERNLYQHRIEKNGDRYEEHLQFMEWAKNYETGDLNMRSLALHRAWIESLNIPVIELNQENTDEQISILLREKSLWNYSL